MTHTEEHEEIIKKQNELLIATSVKMEVTQLVSEVQQLSKMKTWLIGLIGLVVIGLMSGAMYIGTLDEKIQKIEDAIGKPLAEDHIQNTKDDAFEKRLERLENIVNHVKQFPITK